MTETYRNRQWLNPANHSDTGMISSAVSVDIEEENGWVCVDVDLTIWDCSRKISLDLSFYTLEEARQRAEKIDILLRELATIRCKMAEGFEKVYPLMKNK